MEPINERKVVLYVDTESFREGAYLHLGERVELHYATSLQEAIPLYEGSNPDLLVVGNMTDEIDRATEVVRYFRHRFSGTIVGACMNAMLTGDAMLKAGCNIVECKGLVIHKIYLALGI